MGYFTVLPSYCKERTDDYGGEGRLFDTMNIHLPKSRKVDIKFRENWLHRFQNSTLLETVLKSGEVHEQLVSRSFTALKGSLHPYALEIQLYADKFGMIYRMTPERTIPESIFLVVNSTRPDSQFYYVPLLPGLIVSLFSLSDTHNVQNVLEKTG